MMIGFIEPLSRYHLSNALPQAAINVIALGFYQHQYRRFNLKLFWSLTFRKVKSVYAMFQYGCEITYLDNSDA